MKQGQLVVFPTLETTTPIFPMGCLRSSALLKAVLAFVMSYSLRDNKNAALEGLRSFARIFACQE